MSKQIKKVNQEPEDIKATFSKPSDSRARLKEYVKSLFEMQQKKEEK